MNQLSLTTGSADGSGRVKGGVRTLPEIKNSNAQSISQDHLGEDSLKTGSVDGLTLSLPYHLKTVNKSVKFDILKSFCLSFRIGVNGVLSKRTI